MAIVSLEIRLMYSAVLLASVGAVVVCNMI